MAGFIGKDEHLTAADKRLISASSSKVGKGRAKQGESDESSVSADKGQKGTRTEEALRRVTAKLRRLQLAAEDTIDRKASRQRLNLDPAGLGLEATDALRTSAEKSLVERELGVTRPGGE